MVELRSNGNRGEEMAIYAIGDLHLPGGQADKSMSVFGPVWENHPQKLEANWRRNVGGEDLVLVAGDISWAMGLPEAEADLRWLASLPGRKLLIRGNHDYWWSSISKVRRSLPQGVYALQNDHFCWEDWIICGTRGWLCPGEEGFAEPGDEKIYLREVQRLKLSLESAARREGKGLLVALHYPPFSRPQLPSGFTELMEQHGVQACVYGHIHNTEPEGVFQGNLRGIDYYFVAADGVNFTPVLIRE
jgi:predicted phosphohydrolase